MAETMAGQSKSIRLQKEDTETRMSDQCKRICLSAYPPIWSDIDLDKLPVWTPVEKKLGLLPGLELHAE